jgi:hypothetical protein
MKTIHAHIYDPANSLFKAKANDRATCTTIHCSNSDNCELFARGECVLRAIMFASRCPYGYTLNETGSTKRAKGFRTWIQKHTESNKDVPHLDGASDKLAFVGDYIFLPYSHMNMNEGLPFLAHSKFFSVGSSFMPKKDFTMENILKLIDYKPHALMGGEIVSYQKEVVPKFLTHLKEILPELYKQILVARPDRIGVLRSNIGRKAFLSSLRPGVVVTKYHGNKNLDTQHWKWDGEYLTSTDASFSFAIVNYDECHIRLKPKVNEVVEIISEEQVDHNTIYQD